MGGVRGGDGLDGVHLSGEAEGEAEGAVGGQPAEPGHHGDAAVLELGLTHPVESGDVGLLLPLGGLDEAREVLGDGRKVEGVEANIADYGAVKVGRAGEEGDGLGSLRLVDHGVPKAVRHGAEGRGGLVGALGGEGGGRGGAEGSNGELHFSTLLLYRRRESGAYHWHEGARRVEVACCAVSGQKKSRDLSFVSLQECYDSLDPKPVSCSCCPLYLCSPADCLPGDSVHPSH